MYSTASPPPKKEGAKSITPSESKGGNRQPYGNACLYSTRSFQWAQHQNRKAAGFPAAFLRREAPLRRGFLKSVPQAHRNYSLFTLHFITRSCARVKNQGIPPPFRRSPENCSPQGATIQRRGVCRGGRAFPGRPAGLVPRDRAHIPSVCRQRPGGCPGPPVPPLPGTVPSVPGPSCRGWLFPPGCHPASG